MVKASPVSQNLDDIFVLARVRKTELSKSRECARDWDVLDNALCCIRGAPTIELNDPLGHIGVAVYYRNSGVEVGGVGRHIEHEIVAARTSHGRCEDRAQHNG